jgi:hypothetical protein
VPTLRSFPCTSPVSAYLSYAGEGYLWSLDEKQGSFWACGRGGQFIFVLPAKQLVVVMTANLQPGDNRDFTPLKTLFDDYVLPAVGSESPLPADAAAAQELNRRVQQASYPVRPVPALPAVAKQVSGRTYNLAHNDAGWQSLEFLFNDGEPQATVVINGSSFDPPIGLDNVYRVGAEQQGGSKPCLRGEWEADGTFVVHELDMGLPTETTIRIRFEGKDMSVAVAQFPTGNEVAMMGTLQTSPGK